MIPARDTLLLAFQDPPPPAEGVARDWFLVLEGTPVSAQVAAFMARQASDETHPVLEFRLHQNVPNPFRRTTDIAFELPTRTEARLEIFDAPGRRVRGFAGRYEPGLHRIEWDLRDARGRIVPPGIYAYRLVAGGSTAKRKLVVIP